MRSKKSGLSKLFDLKGHVAIVTGSAHGIGRAIAEGLAQVGVSVVLADILDDELQQVATSIKDCNLVATAIPTDLCQPKDLANLVEQAIKEFGKIDILVNCAGVSIGAVCQEYPEDAWELTFNVNVLAAFRLSKLAAKYMIEQKSGRIINLTSIGAVLGFPGNPAYQASKGALLQLTRAMACDWAKYNIRVNNICPGYIKAPMTEKSWSNPDIAKQRASLCMLNRWGDPEELVGPVIFLASNASSYITGNDLFVDGGFAKTGLTEYA
jgi:NAD(P)-dependent dehydrogenase (short-subunit alcohol dehydrogenase family)